MNAVVYFRVVEPIKATVNVQNYMNAVSQQAQTSLRSIIGQSEMDQPLPSGRASTGNSAGSSTSRRKSRGACGSSGSSSRTMSLPGGHEAVHVRQAEAERERRARTITADGEYQASKRLAAAAAVMAKDPAALQLRLLQTVVEVAAEKNSTLVMPVPVELLRFFEKMAPGPVAPTGSTALADAEALRPRRRRGGGAEAAISHTAVAPPAGVPELADVPPVPEVPALPEVAPGEEVRVEES